MTDLSQFLDFMDEVDSSESTTVTGFKSPPMPSPAHPEGKQYHVPSPSAKIGLRLNALADMTIKQSRGIELKDVDVKRLRLNDREEQEFMSQVFTEAVLDEMVEDGVQWEHLRRLAMYAFVYFGVSKEAADQAAKNGLFSGKAEAPTNRAARRAKKTGTRKTSGGSGASKKTTRASSQ